MRSQIRKLLYALGVGEMCSHWMSRRRNKVNAKKLQEVGYRVIGQIDMLLRSSGCVYFANFGTLIGICREGQLLRHDTDIDLSFPPGTDAAKALRTLVDAGFEFVGGFEYDGRITEFTLSYMGIEIDFFLLFVDENGLYYQTYVCDYDLRRCKVKGWTARLMRHKQITGLYTVPFHGNEVAIPVNYDECLTAIYGTWKIPATSWNYIKDISSDRITILDKECHVLSLKETEELLRKQCSR